MFDLMHILEVYICFINSKQAILSIWWKFIFYLLSSRVLEIILKHFTYNFIFVCYLFGIGKGRLELKLKKAKFLVLNMTLFVCRLIYLCYCASVSSSQVLHFGDSAFCAFMMLQYSHFSRNSVYTIKPKNTFSLSRGLHANREGAYI